MRLLLTPFRYRFISLLFFKFLLFSLVETIIDLIFKVNLDDLVWMLNQVDQAFLATRVEEEKEEKKGYLESLV